MAADPMLVQWDVCFLAVVVLGLIRKGETKQKDKRREDAVRRTEQGRRKGGRSEGQRFCDITVIFFLSPLLFESGFAQPECLPPTFPAAVYSPVSLSPALGSGVHE